MESKHPDKVWVDLNNGQETRPLDERERQIDADYAWCLTDSAVQQSHGGQVVAVHERRIWGAGKNHAAAWKAARRERGCPPHDDLVFVVVPGRKTETICC
jgi:hypothetical protein